MNASQEALSYHVKKFYGKQAIARKLDISMRVEQVVSIVKKIIKEVAMEEQRFASSFNSFNELSNRLEGLEVISPNKFRIVLYLTQVGIFNFLDDGKVPGCATLKLSDGRKRSMSLWVEFITASGNLSARKVRSRFHSLVTQVVGKLQFRENVRMEPNTSDVTLIINETLVVEVVPAFQCPGLWPQSAIRWPLMDTNTVWPSQHKITEVKTGGVSLLSKQIEVLPDKQNSVESDSWVISFTEAENKLIGDGWRKKCLSILKTLRDRHLNFHDSPLNSYHMKTLLLYECDKHQSEAEWDEPVIGDRVQGILLQLVSCLRCRRLPHYFIQSVDLLPPSNPDIIDTTAKKVWQLTREIITNYQNYDNL